MNWRSIGLLADPMGVLISLLPRALRATGAPPVTAESEAVMLACRLNKGDIPTLLDLHKRHPDQPAPMLTLCEALEESRQWPELLACAGDLHHRFPGMLAGYQKTAVALRQLKRLDEADRTMQAALRRFPGGVEALVEYAHCADARDTPREALRRWNQVRHHHAFFFPAWRRSVELLDSLGRTAEAEALLKEMRDRFPNNVHTWTVSAARAERHGDTAEALRRWALARQHFPTSPHIYVSQSRLLRRLGDIHAAAAAMVDASYLFPTNKSVLAERDELLKLGADPGPLPPPPPPLP